MISEMKGTVRSIGELKTFASGFAKQEVEIEEDNDKNKYPNILPFTFKKDKTDLVKNLTPGQYVTVRFTTEGSQWTDPKTGAKRNFLSLSVLRIETDAASRPDAPMPSVPDAPADSGSGEDDALPF